MLLKVLGGIRALPVGGDVKAATELLTTVKVRPLNPTAGWTEPTWRDLTPEPQTPHRDGGRTTSASGKRCTR